jgi:hypothetical protein
METKGRLHNMFTAVALHSMQRSEYKTLLDMSESTNLVLIDPR